jgi:hypothetical protein
MPAQRLQKGDDYRKRLIRFVPEMDCLIQERADASHLSFNAALMEFLRASVTPEELRALERKVRKARVRARRTPTPAP